MKTNKEVHVTKASTIDPFSLVGNGRAVVGGRGLRVMNVETGEYGKQLLASRTIVGIGIAPDGDAIVSTLAAYPETQPSIVIVSARDLD